MKINMRLFPLFLSCVVVGSTPVLAQDPGRCHCPRDRVVDDAACQACTQSGTCPSKKCAVLEGEGERQVQRKVSCAWDPANEFCRSGCTNPPEDWMVAVECPSEADKGTCPNYSCTMIRIEYDGPLKTTLPDGSPNPDVDVKDCKKR